jgi:hypothetical protein
MAKDLVEFDISGVPELLRLVEEINATGQPRVLTREGEEVAVLKPSRQSRRSRRKTGVITKEDPIWNLVGIGGSEGPGDIAANKHKYLAEFYKRDHG